MSMKRRWSQKEKLLFLAPLLFLAFYLANSLYSRKVFRHPGKVFSLAFSPDGKSLATGCGKDNIFNRLDGTNFTRIWQMKSGVLQTTFKSPADNTNAVTFSSDGTLLASSSSAAETVSGFGANSSEVRVWDRNTATLLWSSSEKFISSLAFSPDSKTLVSSGKLVRFREAMTGRLIRTVGPKYYQSLQVCFSPDGKMIASAGYRTGIQIWSVHDGKPIKTLVPSKYSNGVNSIAFSPDGRFLVAVYENGIYGAVENQTDRIWDLKTWKATSFNLPNQTTLSVAISPDGKMIATIGHYGIMKLWDFKTGALKRTISVGSPVKTIAFSPDGNQLASGDDDVRVMLWDM